MVVIDLFSGAGGLSEGFHRLGFRFAAKVEKDKWACETLKTRIMYHFLVKQKDLDTYFTYLLSSDDHKNIDIHREVVFKKHPDLRDLLELVVLNRKFGNPNNDKEATSTTQIIREIDQSLKQQDMTSVDLIIGGPPCQAYSLVGRGRMKELAEKDPRNYLFYYYLNMVKYYKPRVFIFENVPGILSAKKGKVFETIKEEFERIGYKLLSGPNKDELKNVLDFNDYGIPQTRKRVLLFGFQSRFDYTYPKFESHKIVWEDPLTTKNVLYDLPPLNPGEGSDHFFGQYTEMSGHISDFQRKMRENSIGVLNHKARPLRELDREIYLIALEKASRGQQLHYDELPERLKTHKNRDSFTDRFRVHREDGLPHTVVAHIAKDGHYNIHPDFKQCRSLTVREAARIQTFPDNYKFEGPRTAQFVQVGNAVPPLMSEIIAHSIKEMLEK
ncbi:DNA (cytosine-5-)-methyltransferase [Polycladomyces sp. WAk]|uniref:Cytosine-specific methyltransferase n=1 Tax=Polycladomyces zharkentensis TaxID=2807616 RepID=A0ABS2WJ50_9BACL|nr:DNA (cytosine-5-)-methyltransferase [Polycladomyces sp. WAk]MBN2909536.1 DNA (cytosine-5-)-methyltransferase [Polycladomyces sp. WAk]